MAGSSWARRVGATALPSHHTTTHSRPLAADALDSALRALHPISNSRLPTLPTSPITFGLAELPSLLPALVHSHQILLQLLSALLVGAGAPALQQHGQFTTLLHAVPLRPGQCTIKVLSPIHPMHQSKPRKLSAAPPASPPKVKHPPTAPAATATPDAPRTPTPGAVLLRCLAHRACPALQCLRRLCPSPKALRPPSSLPQAPKRPGPSSRAVNVQQAEF
jgi:hypothetical protein